MNTTELLILGAVGVFAYTKLKGGIPGIIPPSGGAPPPPAGTQPPSGTTLDFNTAVERARARMGAMAAPWLSASAQDIQSAVCGANSTLFLGNDPIRVALCTGYTPPAAQSGPPAAWNLNGASIMGSYSQYVDSFHNQNGRWLTSSEQESLLARLMPNAPHSFVTAVMSYVNAIGAQWGCAACDPRPGSWLTHAYQDYWLPTYGGIS